MPYICLARGDIPDGIIQILDLVPNTSQRNLTIDPPGQTLYVDRVLVNQVNFLPSGVTRENTIGLKAYLVDRVEPITASIGDDSWSVDKQATVANALIKRVDDGLALTLADVNTILQATFPGTDLTGAGSQSTGVLTEFLSIMSGRGYHLGAGFVKGPGGVWSPVINGSFTNPVTVWGTTMRDGEIGPVNIGGDIQQREVKPVRATVDSDYFLLSLNQGQMGVLSMKPGLPHPTLWPDSSLTPFYPWTYQPGPQIQSVVNARVITVYADDGSVL